MLVAPNGSMKDMWLSKNKKTWKEQSQF
jgi:hypothetical protein